MQYSCMYVKFTNVLRCKHTQYTPPLVIMKLLEWYVQCRPYYKQTFPQTIYNYSVHCGLDYMHELCRPGTCIVQWQLLALLWGLLSNNQPLAWSLHTNRTSGWPKLQVTFQTDQRSSSYRNWFPSDPYLTLCVHHSVIQVSLFVVIHLLFYLNHFRKLLH